jgi:hypothetical protein
MGSALMERHAEYVATYDGRDITPQPSQLVCVPCGELLHDCTCTAPETRHPMWKAATR